MTNVNGWKTFVAAAFDQWCTTVSSGRVQVRQRTAGRLVVECPELLPSCDEATIRANHRNEFAAWTDASLGYGTERRAASRAIASVGGHLPIPKPANYSDPVVRRYASGYGGGVPYFAAKSSTRKPDAPLSLSTEHPTPTASCHDEKPSGGRSTWITGSRYFSSSWR